GNVIGEAEESKPLLESNLEETLPDTSSRPKVLVGATQTPFAAAQSTRPRGRVVEIKLPNPRDIKDEKSPMPSDIKDEKSPMPSDIKDEKSPMPSEQEADIDQKAPISNTTAEYESDGLLGQQQHNSNSANSGPEAKSGLIFEKQQGSPYLQILLISVITYVVTVTCLYHLVKVDYGFSCFCAITVFSLTALGTVLYPDALPCPSLMLINRQENVPFQSSLMREDKERGVWARAAWGCALIAVSAAIVLAIGGGYYYRELEFSSDLSNVFNIRASKPAESSWGTMYFESGSHVSRMFGGGGAKDSKGAAAVPCAAPIFLSDKDIKQKVAYYWALSDRRCCDENPPICPKWTHFSQGGSSGYGAVRIGYMDPFPNAIKLIDTLEARYGLLSSKATRTYVRWVEPDSFKRDLEWRAAVCLAMSLAILVGGVSTIVIISRNLKLRMDSVLLHGQIQDDTGDILDADKKSGLTENKIGPGVSMSIVG
ncbi:hypothetical protein AAMO2058_001607500, partial [Amorphochlora amoebiformis]